MARYIYRILWLEQELANGGLAHNLSTESEYALFSLEDLVRGGSIKLQDGRTACS